jgi:hypothetical protein
MAGLKVKLNNVVDDIESAIRNMDLPVRDACTAAIVTAGTAMATLGFANIKGALKGSNIARSWTVRYYPGNAKRRPSKPSINAAAWGYSKVPFVKIFEDGGTIHGKPMLWLPLRNAPLAIGRGRARGHITPRKLREEGIKLFSITRAGKVPLLATKINATRAGANRVSLNTTLAALRRSKKAPTGRQVPVTVPLFFGVPAVNIRKKLNLDGIAQAQRDLLAEYYVVNLQVA